MKSLILKILYKLAHVDDTPERTALAFAIGVFLSFSPFLGLHTLLGILVAFAFGLNRVALLIGVYCNTPWTLVPFYAFSTWLGLRILGDAAGPTFWPEAGLRELLHLPFWTDLARNWRLLIPTFVGSMVLSILLALAAYPLALKLIRKIRSKPRPEPKQKPQT